MGKLIIENFSWPRPLLQSIILINVDPSFFASSLKLMRHNFSFGGEKLFFFPEEEEDWHEEETGLLVFYQKKIENFPSRKGTAASDRRKALVKRRDNVSILRKSPSPLLGN